MSGAVRNWGQEWDHPMPKDAGQGSRVLGVRLGGGTGRSLSTRDTRPEWAQQTQSWSPGVLASPVPEGTAPGAVIPNRAEFAPSPLQGTFDNVRDSFCGYNTGRRSFWHLASSSQDAAEQSTICEAAQQ